MCGEAEHAASDSAPDDEPSSIAEAIWEIRRTKPDVRHLCKQGAKGGLQVLAWLLTLAVPVMVAVTAVGNGSPLWEGLALGIGAAVVIGTVTLLWAEVIGDSMGRRVDREYDFHYAQMFEALRNTSLSVVLLGDDVWQEVFRDRGFDVLDLFVPRLHPPTRLAERIAFSAAFFDAVCQYMSQREVSDYNLILTGYAVLAARDMQGRRDQTPTLTYYARYNALCDFFSRYEAEAAPNMTWREYQDSIHPNLRNREAAQPPTKRPLPPSGFDQFAYLDRPESDAADDRTDRH